MTRYYILDGHEPIPTDNLLEWARWYATANRRVAFDQIANSEISTVFLGLSYRGGEGAPLLFETMVFVGPLDQEHNRYSTWDDAAEGHRQMVDRVRKNHLRHEATKLAAQEAQP